PRMNVLGRELVGQVNHPRFRAAAGDHAVADADEAVAQAIVGEKRDHREAPDTPAAASATSASINPSMSWRSASTLGSRPCARSASLVTGPIETRRVP